MRDFLTKASAPGFFLSFLQAIVNLAAVTYGHKVYFIARLDLVHNPVIVNAV